MANSRFCFLILAVCLIFTSFLLTVNASGSDLEAWLPTRSGSTCDGTLAECLAAGGDSDDEFLLDSEISRRILATSRYISYNALNKNRTPCSRRGASYYNCRAGASANPYSRGCSAIARCRR